VLIPLIIMVAEPVIVDIISEIVGVVLWWLVLWWLSHYWLLSDCDDVIEVMMLLIHCCDVMLLVILWWWHVDSGIVVLKLVLMKYSCWYWRIWLRIDMILLTDMMTKWLIVSVVIASIVFWRNDCWPVWWLIYIVIVGNCPCVID